MYWITALLDLDTPCVQPVFMQTLTSRLAVHETNQVHREKKNHIISYFALLRKCECVHNQKLCEHVQ